MDGMPPRPRPPRHMPMTRAEMDARGWDALDVVFVTGDAYVDHPSFAMAILGPRAGGGGLPRRHPQPARLAERRAVAAVRPAAAVLRRQRRQHGLDDQPLHRQQEGPQRRRLLAPAAGSACGPTGRRSPTASAAARRSPACRSSPAASRRRCAGWPTTTTGATPSAVDPARLQGRPARLRHGRARHRRDRRPARRRRDGQGPARHARRGLCCWARARRRAERDAVELPTLRGASPSRKSDKPAPSPRRRASSTSTPTRSTPRRWCSATTARSSCNPPALPLDEAEMDASTTCRTRARPHPSYTEPIPAYEMIKDSVTIMRGCFGGCTFCSITAHQGRIIQSRSQESVLQRGPQDGGRPRVQGRRSATSAARPPTCTRCAARGPRSRRSASGCRACIRRSASCSAPTTAR